jgi:CheY-like chemotaxis protein
MRKALIVLSEPDVARLVADHLAHQGFQSKVLTEGLPVMSHAREGQPDLIILNYNSLPDVFGADVCRALKADPATKHISVILVSSIGWKENEDQTGTLGADGYLLMSFTPEELAAMVQDCSSEVANSETQTYGNPTELSVPLEHQQRRFFRFASPMCLVGTLILFMLPWVDVRCYSPPRQFSGFDLAFGGWSETKPGIRIPMIVFTCILIGGIVAGFALAGPHLMPSIRRAIVVGWAGLLCILLPLSLTFTYREFIFRECRFTLWYYLSYVTSAGSVLLSVMEAQTAFNKPGGVARIIPGWLVCLLLGSSLWLFAGLGILWFALPRL